MEFQDLIYLGIPSISAIVAIWLAIASWKRRPAPGAAAFAVTMISIAIFGIGYVFELGSASISSKQIWVKIEYIGIVVLPTAWLVFTLHYTGLLSSLNSRMWVTMIIVPAVFYIFVLTNQSHGLIGDIINIKQIGIVSVVSYKFGAVFWAFIAYSYLLLLAGLGIILRTMLSSFRHYRRQIGALAVGAAAPMIANLIYIFDLSPFAGLDLTPFAFTITGLTTYWGLFQLNLLDSMPIPSSAALIENMGDGVLVLDQENRVIDINPALQDILDIVASKTIGSQVEDVFVAWPHLVEILLKSDSGSSEFVLEDKNTRKYFDIKISPIRSKLIEESGSLVVFRDTSIRVEAEGALRKGEQQYRRLVESSPISICVMVEGKYVYANPAAYKLFGAEKPDELIGKAAGDFVHSDFPVPIGEKLDELKDSRSAIGSNEGMIVRVDGQSVEVEVSTELITYQNQEAVQVLMKDISARKRSEENYKHLIETSPEAIAVHASGKFVYANPAFLNLYAASKADQIIGKEVLGFLHPDYREQEEERMKMIKLGIEWTGDNQGKIIRLDGKTINVEASADQISFQGKDAIQIVLRDISARKLEEERLERQVEELAVLHSIAVAAAQATSEDELIEEATMIVGSVLFPSNFGFLLIDKESQTLLLHNSYRFENEAPRGDVLPIPLGHGITGAVAQTGAAIRIGDVSEDARYLDIHSNIRSELCVPIKSGQKVLGVINSESDELNAFNEADERLLQTIAGQLAAGIEKVRFFEEIQRLAVTDSLTGLNNRRYFFDLARKEFERARRFQHSLVAIMLDVDEFRGINEKFGHAGGDLTLTAIAYSWMQELREVDVIGRYGGDEFAILLPETDLKAGKEIAERLCKIAKAMTVESERGMISVTISSGVASLMDNSLNIENLIDRADRGLYLSKEAGGDTVSVVVD